MGINAQDVINALVVAVECSQALDMRHNKGLVILEKHGFVNDARFDLSPSEFVKIKQDEALAVKSKFDQLEHPQLDEFVKRLMKISGVSKQYADAAYFTISINEQTNAIQQADRYARQYGLTKS